MANKKYYWLKLKEDFFEEDAISWIEEQEKGKDYCLFYLKLCLKSLKSNGLLIRNVGNMLVPYDPKTLAKITNTDIDTVRVAMDILTKIGLIQILENGEIFITQLQNMVGSETSKAQLMRNKRKKDKELIKNSGNNVTPMLLSCYSNEENRYTEIEKEIEIEIEQDTDKDNVVVSCFKYSQQVGIMLTPYHYQEIVSFMEDGIEEQLIIKAIDIAVGNGNRNFNYVKGIINNWLTNNLKTVIEVENHQERFEKKKNKGETDGKYQEYAKHLDRENQTTISNEEARRAAEKLGIEL